MSTIHIVCGVGGAGKTTLSAALGLRAASLGLRTVVLTIDPAKRLADALGLDHLGNEPVRIALDGAGSLDALMLDRKATFDALVRDNAPTPALANRLMSNRYYEAVSTRLTGGHELMAVEKLHTLLASERWDAIIVDTPPSRHAIDFLRAPDRIAQLLDHRLAQALLRPSDGLLGAATRRVSGLVRKLAGDGVLTDLDEFFTLAGQLGDGFRERGASVAAALRKARSTCWLVAPADNPRFSEIKALKSALQEEHIALAGILVNRFTTPLPYLPDALLRRFPTPTDPRETEAYAQALAWTRTQLQSHQGRADRHAQTLARLQQSFQLPLWPVPELETHADSLQALQTLAQALPELPAP